MEAKNQQTQIPPQNPVGIWYEDQFYVADNCGFCGSMIVFEPHSVHSARPFGVGPKRAICPTCFQKWNMIHRSHKGLEPIPFNAEAYPAHLQPEQSSELDTGLGE